MKLQLQETRSPTLRLYEREPGIREAACQDEAGEPCSRTNIDPDVFGHRPPYQRKEQRVGRVTSDDCLERSFGYEPQTVGVERHGRRVRKQEREEIRRERKLAEDRRQCGDPVAEQGLRALSIHVSR
jgi:hypothetical protein